jgi:pyrroloquinoline quinone biosynthesis protein D
MNERAIIGPAFRPKLAEHRKLRFDKARNSWAIQAPERAFMLDEIAHAIVSRCDGTRSLATIVDELCLLADGAPRDVIEADVTQLVQDFVDKGVMLP